MLNESVFDVIVSGGEEEDDDDDDDNPWSNLNVPYVVAESLVAMTAIIGNLMVIVVYLKERRLRKRTKYYIISLAIADLLVGFFGIPFAILASVGLPRNSSLCLLNMSLLIVLCTISIYCLVAVSVDRYWAILYPMSYSRNVRSKTAVEIIIICWLTGAIVGFLPLLGWNEGSSPNRKCFFVEVMNYDYLVFLYLSTIIAPAVLLAAFYAHIYRVVLQQVRQMVLLSTNHSVPKKTSSGPLRLLGTVRKKEVKATQNLSIIVLFFIVCWFPLYTINFVKALCRDCEISPILTNSCIILSHLNSSFNPFLYAYHLKDFRVAVNNLLFRHKGIPLRLQKSSFLQRFRPPSVINRGEAPAPTSSVCLCHEEMVEGNAEGKNRPRKKNRLKARKKMKPNRNLHFDGCMGGEIAIAISNRQLETGSISSKLEPPRTHDGIFSSESNLSRFRSQSVRIFPTEGIVESFGSPKTAMEFRNSPSGTNDGRSNRRTHWKSCNDLRKQNYNGGETTVKF